jgi:hypothetical protein
MERGRHRRGAAEKGKSQSGADKPFHCLRPLLAAPVRLFPKADFLTTIPVVERDYGGAGLNPL